MVVVKAKMPKFICNDCGVDVIQIGDWYMAQPELWKGELGLGWGDNLCISCLRGWMGREFRTGFSGFEDIAPASTYFPGQPPISDFLLKLWGLTRRKKRVRQQRKQT
jgi:hypothetical protein